MQNGLGCGFGSAALQPALRMKWKAVDPEVCGPILQAGADQAKLQCWWKRTSRCSAGVLPWEPWLVECAELREAERRDSMLFPALYSGAQRLSIADRMRLA